MLDTLGAWVTRKGTVLYIFPSNPVGRKFEWEGSGKEKWHIFAMKDTKYGCLLKDTKYGCQDLTVKDLDPKF